MTLSPQFLDDIEETTSTIQEEKPRSNFFGLIVPFFIGLAIAFLLTSMLKSLRYSVALTPHPFDGQQVTLEAELSAHIVRPIWWGTPNSMLTVVSAQIEDSQHHIVQATYQAGNTRQVPSRDSSNTIDKYWLSAALTPQSPCDLSHGGHLLICLALENADAVNGRPMWEGTYPLDIPASTAQTLPLHGK